jgi:hypothetical protein
LLVVVVVVVVVGDSWDSNRGINIIGYRAVFFHIVSMVVADVSNAGDK